YVIGGYNTRVERSDKIEIYDPNSDSWTTSSSVSPASNVEPKSVTYKGNIYLIGVGGSFVFSPSTETISSLPSIPTPKYVDGSGLGLLNGKLYSIGGSAQSTVFEYTLEKSGNPGTDPEPEPNGSRAILTVTMNTGLEKEFDLSMEEVNAFINWYDTKESGSGPAKFAINKHGNNKGP
ncbi:hypothetical protein PZ740_08835, partial [Rhodospirillales bacterium YIM 152171]|nr:hypothetical protein [Marinimicrococcus flavescens]